MAGLVPCVQQVLLGLYAWHGGPKAWIMGSISKFFGQNIWTHLMSRSRRMPSTHRTSGPCFGSFREGYVADFESSHGFC